MLQTDGQVALNRDLANWPRSIVREPYTQALTDILGEPIPADKMWNPDAVLRIEDIKHPEATKARLDKAAACQMVFEDAIFHIVDHFIRATGSERLVLTGGVGLNALANMRLLEHFDEDYFRREHGRAGRLHLWVPPTPNDAGVPIGAAYMGAYLAGYGLGAPVTHAFYCGAPPAAAAIRAALTQADDVQWIELAACDDTTRAAYADFMAYMTAHDAIFALYQGAAETGPRALGHRSILANPCNPQTRENLNARVKYREAIRPLAPMMTLEAAQQFFELSDGASDADYNAYNYMVLTAHAKPEARQRIPSVVHADGTGRLQIVREETDPLTYAYLKALGRRIGVEVAVNTSFNVAGPIAQTPAQALATLRRSQGLDAVLMVSAEGPVFAALHGGAGGDGGKRFRQWLKDWQARDRRAAGKLTTLRRPVGQPRVHKDRQPHRRRAGFGPGHPVPAMGRQEHAVAGTEHALLRLAFDGEPGAPAHEQNPFGLVLVVPEAVRRGLAVGDDALHANAVACEQRLDRFVGARRRKSASRFRIGGAGTAFLVMVG